MTDSLGVNRYNLNITTGIVTHPSTAATSAQQTQNNEASFADVLKGQVEQSNIKLSFSKHAQNRIADRSIDMGQERLERLNQGVILANDKGLNDALILVDKTAFIVNAKNGTVITTLNGDDLNGNVFTNIEGTVIV